MVMENNNQDHTKMVEDFWRGYLLEGPPAGKIRRQRFYQMLPSDARCRFCQAPFNGVPGSFVKNVFRVYPSRYNPHYCNVCDEFSKQFQGGAEVPITMLFADIRGSSSLAESIGAKEFSMLINRFYIKSTNVLTRAGGLIEKLVGDEVTSIFSRGLAGDNYHLVAIQAAQDLLRSIGYTAENGTQIQVGIGIHSGETFVGSVGKPSGVMEVAALGEVPNIASRLTSLAGPGEILVSADTVEAAGVSTHSLEQRRLKLKGHEKEITAFAFHAHDTVNPNQ
jgi:adenylate cyclase